MADSVYIAIDLKSFYASVECVERKLDPMATNLVVADASRTNKTICLAVSPSLKAFGIPGRARLFEVVERERKLQQAMLDVKKRYGKNAMVKGMNLQEGATTMERNRQIGGHKA